MRGQIETIRNRIPDECWYGSEEFQTLLALANSGRADFAKDDKELMIRTLREFSLSDLLFLQKLFMGPSGYNNSADDEHDEAIARMSRLLGAGLVKEQSIPARAETVTRIFQLSRYGKRFLAFLETESQA